MVRLEEFDIMKGVAMLSVIVSHICLPEFFALYHVPLFFFVSGYFFKKKTISENLRINCSQLLVPYLKCGGGILLCYLLFYGTEYASIYSKDLIMGTCVKNDLSVFLGPLWFLLTLFWVRFFLNMCDSPLMTMIISFIFSALCAYIGDEFDWFSVPFMILQSIPAMFFFSVGQVCRNYKLLQKKIGKLDLLLPVVIVLIAISYFQIQVEMINISMMKLSFFPYSFLNSLLLIYVFWRISFSLKKVNIIAKTLRFCGEKSLDFLVCHSYAFCLLLPLLSKYQGNLETRQEALLFLLFNIVLNVVICYAYAYIKTLLLKLK